MGQLYTKLILFAILVNFLTQQMMRKLVIKEHHINMMPTSTTCQCPLQIYAHTIQHISHCRSKLSTHTQKTRKKNTHKKKHKNITKVGDRLATRTLQTKIWQV